MIIIAETLVLGTIVFLILLSSLIYWLESRRPGFERPSNFDRRLHSVVNIKAGLVALVATAAANACVFVVAHLAESREFGLVGLIYSRAPGLPRGVNLVAGLFALDYSNYWIHRVQHLNPLLWRFHRVHHTDPAIDVTSGMRFHPFESFFRGGCQSIIVITLGLSARSLEVYLWVQTAVLVWSHANLRIGPIESAGPLALVVGPAMHQRHHDITRKRHDSNYGIVLACWDWLHRSHSGRQSNFSIKQGLPDASEVSQTLFGILFEPFRRPADGSVKF